MTASELHRVEANETDYLLGLFGTSHIEYDHERRPGRDPSLTDLAEKAMEERNLNHVLPFFWNLELIVIFYHSCCF